MTTRAMGRPLDSDIDDLLKASNEIAEKAEALRAAVSELSTVGRVNEKADALRRAITDAAERLGRKE